MRQKCSWGTVPANNPLSSLPPSQPHAPPSSTPAHKNHVNCSFLHSVSWGDKYFEDGDWKVLAKTRVRALGFMFSSNKDTSYHVTSFAGKDDSQRAMKQWVGICQWGYNWRRFVTSAPISFACSCLENIGCACGNHKSSSCPPEEQTTPQVSEFRQPPVVSTQAAPWWLVYGRRLN